jgi:hypothetical protein
METKRILIDKYVIFFVNGNEFIQPRHLEYNSYYPIGKGENAVNNKVKDTLFFKLDNKYVYRSKYEPKSFLLKDGHDVTSGFYFETVQIVNNLEPKEILSLENFLRSSKFYNEKLNDYQLWEYFNYVVVLVEGVLDKKKYIQVKSGFEIE